MDAISQTGRNMYDLIPFIQKHEFDIILNELKGIDLSVIFDGTTPWVSISYCC